ncbi:MAG: hypothetical protein U0T84_01980 [Chitinophagales bacterium]
MRFLENEIYHVFNRSVNREVIFNNDENYQFFLGRLDKYVSGHADLLAYCLMPTHFHLVIKVKGDTKELSRGFTNFFISYAKAFNHINNRHGSLFQNRFKGKIIDSGNYLTNLICYIHQNPVAGELVENCSEWKYSSYNAILSSAPTKVNRDAVLEWYGSKDAFVKHHQGIIKNLLELRSLEEVSLRLAKPSV